MKKCNQKCNIPRVVSLQADPNPTSIYKWIKENVDQSLFTNPKFINLLISNVIRHIASESTLHENVDRSVAPEKGLLEKEKELLEKFKVSALKP